MQKQGIKNYPRWILSLASLCLLVSCTSDPDTATTQNKDYASYTGSALSLPSSIHIAEANSSQTISSQATSTSLTPQGISPLAVADDPNTDFSTDPVLYYQNNEGNT